MDQRSLLNLHLIRVSLRIQLLFPDSPETQTFTRTISHKQQKAINKELMRAVARFIKTSVNRSRLVGMIDLVRFRCAA